MYKVIPIGAQFTGRGHEQLAQNLSEYERDGWRLVQVFPVLVTGCLGLSKQQTNYAVLHRVDSSATASESSAAAAAIADQAEPKAGANTVTTDAPSEQATQTDTQHPYQRPLPGWARERQHDAKADTGDLPDD